MNYHFGFIMEQVAGHITNYHNLRSVADGDPEVHADWCEVFYYREGGAIEKLRERLLPFIPTYFTGILRASVDMQRGMRLRRYDALFTNATVAIFFSPALRQLPTVVDIDATPLQLDQMEGYHTRRDPGPVEAIKYRLFRGMLHAATLVQAWSHWAKRSAVEEYGVPAENIFVNPPGVNLLYWRPAPAQRAAGREEPLKVLFVGGDFRRKGGNDLLEWYRTQSPEQCELHIVTREPVQPGPGVFVYHGMQPNSQELLELYQRSDLFVLPSKGECFGIATVEAMAAGLPVIASDVGGTADIIEPGRNGYIVPAGDKAELAGAIEAILSDEQRRLSMGVQSRKLAEERFDLGTNARRTLSFLKQITRMPVTRAHAS